MPVCLGSRATSCSATPMRSRTCLRLRGDVVAGHRRLPAGGGEQGAEHLHGGRLAGAVGSEEAVDLTPLDGEVEPVDRGHVVEGAGQPGGRDGWLGDRSWGSGHVVRFLVAGLVIVCMGSNLRITAVRSCPQLWNLSG